MGQNEVLAVITEYKRITFDDLKKKTGFSDPSIFRSLKKLKEGKLIKVEHIIGSSNFNTSIYVIIEKPKKKVNPNFLDI